MTREDHEHIAQCCLSLKHLMDRKEVLDDGEFKLFIDRLVWAIGASKGGANEPLDFDRFVKGCRGETTT